MPRSRSASPAVVIRPTDEDRDRAVDHLKEGYVSGSLDDEEFRRRMALALTTTDRAMLIAVAEPASAAGRGRVRRTRRWRIPAAIAASVAAAAVGFAALNGGSSGAADQGPPYCDSTGLTAPGTDCPMMTVEQLQIEKDSQVAQEAFTVTSDVFEANGGSNADLRAAYVAAQEAGATAEQAVADGQAVVLRYLGKAIPEGAFDDALSAAREARQAAIKAQHAADLATR